MSVEWQKISENRYKAGYRNIINKTFKLPNGLISSYDIVDNGSAVCAVALTEDSKFIMVKIYRPGPEKVLLEMPGGLLDAGFTPEEAIAKELLEETGYKGDFEFVGTTYEDAYSTMFRYHFVCRNCQKVQEPTLEEDEGGAETVLLTLDEFKQNLFSGNVTDPETGYIGLYHLGLL